MCEACSDVESLLKEAFNEIIQARHEALNEIIRARCAQNAALKKLDNIESLIAKARVITAAEKPTVDDNRQSILTPLEIAAELTTYGRANSAH